MMFSILIGLLIIHLCEPDRMRGAACMHEENVLVLEHVTLL